jgi:Endonuclease/Exonuclease/phosphatase family
MLKDRRTVVAALFALAALSLASCFSSDSPESDSEPDRASPALGEEMRLQVLVYNIEYGGNRATDRVIRRVDADVVGVLESYDRLPAIAEKTGYPYYNVSLQLLSKYPIHEPSGGDGLYALIEVQPGYVIPFFNDHLDYVEWGPRALRNGASVKSVIETENQVRTSALAKPLAAMTMLIEQGYPVFLTGDFNEPSSLDYAKETIGSRKGINQPVPWPVSEALFEIGFRDTYREEHPDPLKEPGITHRSGERIDYVYAGGPSRTLASEIVGEKGGQDVSIEHSPWTSDHRAVLSTFEVKPVAMPTMVSVDASLRTVGDRISVSHSAPDSDGNQIAIVPEGGDPQTAARRLDARGKRGTTTINTSSMDPGVYEAVLVDGEGGELAQVSFWLRDPQAETQLSTDRRTYGRGEAIEVNWSDGPANRWDWLGVYKAPAANSGSDYLIWEYTGRHAAGTVPPRIEGSATLGAGSQGRPWPLPPGRYIVRYLLADQYESAGEARFSVRR